MTLKEILDEVRFAAGDICICVENDETSLDKYYEGKYFHIDSNWDRGSNSWATPDIPEELMEHEVLQVWNLTNLEEVYGRINKLQVSGMQNRVVIFVEEGYDFDQDSFWTEDNINDEISAEIEEWPFSISKETFDKIEELSNNPFELSSAVKNLLYEGVQTVKCMTEEEIASLDDATAEFYRLMKRVVEITDDVDDIVSYCQAVGYLNPFIH